MMFISNTYILLGFVGALLWYYSTSTFGFWKRLKIKFKKPAPFVGNMGRFVFQIESFSQCLHELYTYFRDDRYAGFFQLRRPVLLIRDPDLVHSVLVTDFAHFVDRGFDTFVNLDKILNPLLFNLFTANGDHWKALRRKMRTIFTPAKVKAMDGQIGDCVQKLNLQLEKELQPDDGSADVDLRLIFGGLAADVVCSCGFGINCDSMELKKQFIEHTEQVFELTLSRSARVLVGALSMKLVRLLKLRDLPIEASDFYTNLVVNTMRMRRRDKIERPDLLQLLMGLQNAYRNLENAPDGYENLQPATIEDRFDEIDIVANALLFFQGGVDTAATTLAYCVYELAINQHIQNRVREEVEDVYNKNNQSLDVETLKELPYLEATIAETMRKHPPVSFTLRRAGTDYNIPGTNQILPKGTVVMIPVRSIQRDWKYFPNPELFDPERFYGENATKIRKGTYLPFGEGPRNCIAINFAKMEMKRALADFVLKYNISPCSRTKIPPENARGTLFVVSKELWVNITKRTI